MADVQQRLDEFFRKIEPAYADLCDSLSFATFRVLVRATIVARRARQRSGGPDETPEEEIEAAVASVLNYVEAQRSSCGARGDFFDRLLRARK